MGTRRIVAGTVVIVLFFITLRMTWAEDTALPSNPAVAAALQPFLDHHQAAGFVALVGDKDRILSLTTVGYADLENKIPMSADTLFWIASMTKPMTATALMMLADEGKLVPEDPVEKYLPSFSKQMVGIHSDPQHLTLVPLTSPVTLKELLTHTSGISPNSPFEPRLDMGTLYSTECIAALNPLDAQPGTAFSYSNLAMDTVGRVVEVVSGTPYADFMAQRIFQPLHMDHTTFWPSDDEARKIAVGYQVDAATSTLTPFRRIGYLTYPLSDPKRKPAPAAGVFSTAADLYKFCRMYLNGGEVDGTRYLKPETIAEMTKSQTGTIPPPWGMGWMLNTFTPGTYGHHGAFQTQMTIDPKDGLISILLVQCPAGFNAPSLAFEKVALVPQTNQ